MAIRAQGVAAVTIGELLEQDLHIPDYQRPYVWTPATALRLLDDIRHAVERDVRTEDGSLVPYVLGAVILHSDNENLAIVDGQQRLLTLRMLLRLLNGEELAADANQDSPVALVWNALRQALTEGKDARTELADFIRNSCQVIRVETDDIDEAFRVFDSQNYRGKPLAPHDLLKAHHLREMRDESSALKAAVVDRWESAGDEALDELFSMYLYRIAKWSRGEVPTKFSTQDLDEFRGISPAQANTPSMRYHLAAQSVIPILNAWQVTSRVNSKRSPENDRDAARARFQLDAPILAGEAFFERTAFLLDELNDLKQQSFPARENSISSSDNDLTFNDKSETFGDKLALSRYRKVTELYLAAILYFVNKFSDSKLNQIRNQVFAWAYGYRVRLLRVQEVSIRNAGASADSPFVLLRTSRDGNELTSMNSNISEKDLRDDFETDLLALINDLRWDARNGSEGTGTQ